jgi:hypothetical protein
MFWIFLLLCKQVFKCSRSSQTSSIWTHRIWGIPICYHNQHVYKDQFVWRLYKDQLGQHYFGSMILIILWGPKSLTNSASHVCSTKWICPTWPHTWYATIRLSQFLYLYYTFQISLFPHLLKLYIISEKMCANVVSKHLYLYTFCNISCM